MPKIVGLLLFYVFLHSQSAGAMQAADKTFSFQGKVSTAVHVAVPEAVVSLTDAADHLLAQTSTDMEGKYLLAEIPLANASYKIRCAKIGYSDSISSFPISSDSDQTATLDLVLSPQTPEEAAAKRRGGTVTHVKVFFGTDRAVQGQGNSTIFENGVSSDTMTYGWSDVAIPPGHRAGTADNGIWKLVVSPNADEDITVSSVTPETSQQFFLDLSQATNSSGKNAFVFVHGYNVTFKDALRRTAQLAFDMHFSGVPIAYSWPSKGVLLSYKDDEYQIEATKDHLKAFLSAIQVRSGATNIYLIAHSMGNRALLSVLSDMAQHNAGAMKSFREVVSAAPDVFSNDFMVLAANIDQAVPLTLYASSRDQALRASVFLHHGKVNAGLLTGDQIIVLPHMVTVDATAVTSDWLGHTYYGDVPCVIGDIAKVFANTPLPRNLVAMKLGPSQYWLLKP